MVEKRAAREHGDVFFACINQLRVFLARRWRWTKCQQAVFRMQKHVFVSRQILGNLGGQAYAQIHIRAVGNVLRHTGGNLVTRQFGISHGWVSLLRGRNLHHVLNKNAWGDDVFWVELAQSHHFRHLGDGAIRRRGHDGAEIAR